LELRWWTSSFGGSYSPPHVVWFCHPRFSIWVYLVITESVQDRVLGYSSRLILQEISNRLLHKLILSWIEHTQHVLYFSLKIWPPTVVHIWLESIKRHCILQPWLFRLKAQVGPVYFFKLWVLIFVLLHVLSSIILHWNVVKLTYGFSSF
jgi:hypothetical protein